MQVTNLAELMQVRAQQYGDKVLYNFILDSLHRDEITFYELNQRAKIVAGELLQVCQSGSRALLFFQPGIPYIEAFMGCIYAGIIPVPVYPPDSRNLQRLLTIIEDSGAYLAISTTLIREKTFELYNQGLSNNVKEQAYGLIKELTWFCTDSIEITSQPFLEPYTFQGDDIAFLQYTSGSTNNPKGVMVTHENLIYHAHTVQESFRMSDNQRMISWLPPYHDMGLIGSILQPLYAGMPATLMSPMYFMKKPVRWLECITEHNDEEHIISGAPDFAYAVCAKKVTEEQKSFLDLSKWKVAFSGAEPVRADTLRRFTQAFASCYFKSKFFFPVYGLAEATLLVSAGDIETDPVIQTFHRGSLEEDRVEEVKDDTGKAVDLVGCGWSHPEQQVRIVDPITNMACEKNRVGEIWIAGKSVAKGYWQNQEQTEYTFHAYVKDTWEGPFFRTGDLGVIKNNQLFITGRLKELLVIRGKNHYPNDIEDTIQQIHPALRMTCGTVLSIMENGTGKLIVVQEVERQYRKKIDQGEMKEKILSEVALEHGLHVDEVILVEPSSLPKTSSGKLQRLQIKHAYVNKSLKVLPNENLVNIS